MNFIYGLLNLAFLLSQVISPIGWMFIFLTGPYDSRELNADDEQIHIREAETGIEHRLPFILEPKTEKVYIITYDYSLKRKHFDEGFPRNARIECVADVKRRPWWKLPRAGDGVWLADGALLVQTAGKWIKFKTHLGPSLVRLHLPLKDFSCD
jgi:hypothetical protein